MKDSIKERYCAVIYTDGKKFISPMLFGRETTINLPKVKFNAADPDSAAMQATLALFNQTGIRLKPRDLDSLGVFNLQGDFEVDLYYFKADRLPNIDTLKSNVMFSLVHHKDERINSIEGYKYISFEDLNRFEFFSLKGLKDVLWKVDQHFEKGIAWRDIG